VLRQPGLERRRRFAGGVLPTGRQIVAGPVSNESITNFIIYYSFFYIFMADCVGPFLFCWLGGFETV
jgi:hypothetical protein